MQQHFVRSGALLGAATIVFNLIIYLISPKFLVSWGSWAGLVITIYFMSKAVKDTRNDLRGFISLSDAFKASWLTYVLGAFLTTVFMFILTNNIDPGLVDVVKQTQIEAIEEVAVFFNIPESQMEEQISMIEDTNPFGLATVALSLPLSFLFPGAVFAIIMAAIMKKNDPKLKEN